MRRLLLMLSAFLWVSFSPALLYASPDEGYAPQTTTVSGVVTDDTGAGMPGVNVIVKGTSNGTTTDVSGRFTLGLSSEDMSGTLVFSFIGYTSQEQAIANRTLINVTMMPDVVQLTEVVVVGYGTQEKRDVTASISSIGKDQIQKIATTNTLDAMKGQIAGVDVLQSSGRPGQAPNIQIRGRRSINASNDPLFVIDGVPMTAGTGGGFRYDATQQRSVRNDDQGNNAFVPATVSINDFNPADIESIEVLKDAAATAIYGSRGANGVVLITTKRGRSGKTTVSYNGSYGVTEAFSQFPVMGGEQFANLKREANRISPLGVTGRTAWEGTIPADNIVFIDPIELNAATTGVYTDWQDLVFKTGAQSNQQLSVMGGTDKTQFNIALGYWKEDGIISGMDFTKVTTRVNVDHQISKMFKVGSSTLLSYTIQNGGGAGAALVEAVNQTPLAVPYDAAGQLIFLPISDGIRSNPLNELVPGKKVNEDRSNRVFSSVYGEVSLFQGLKYKLLIGTDIGNSNAGSFDGQFTNSRKNGTPAATLTRDGDFGYTVENLLTYNKRLSERHDIGVTFLQSVQANTYSRVYNSVADLPYESQLWHKIETAPTVVAKESRIEEWRLASFMGRINYSFGGKYLVQATLRADGSSRLATGDKWTNFPGLSLGWRVSDEAFMANLGFLDELKVRASYGVVGNTSVRPYQTQGILAGPTAYSWDEVPALGFRLSEIPNEDLSWEKSATTNVGMDFGLFGSRVHGTLDVYKTETTDLLLQRNLPITSGYNFIFSNIGATQTNGFELSLGSTILDLPSSLKWNLDFNIAHYKEQIVDLALRGPNGEKVDDTGNAWFIGQPIRVYYQYKKIGIWQANEFDQAQATDQAYPGEIRVQDTDENGTITPADRVIVGTDVPKAYGGVNNRLAFKGIDLSFFLYYRLGFTLDSRFEDSQATMQARYNNIDADYWTIDNPSNEYPRPNKNQEFPQKRETLRYRDGGFVKLRNVTLAYSFPRSITDRLKMTNLRVFFTAQNPKVWSKYKVFDPESLNQIEAGDIPPTKLYMGGLNVTF